MRGQQLVNRLIIKVFRKFIGYVIKVEAGISGQEGISFSPHPSVEEGLTWC